MKNLILVILVVVVSACGNNPKDTETNEDMLEAMEMLESVFVGPYNKFIIKEKMDLVFEMYDVAPKREDYLMVGNTLVALRKQSRNAYVEMDIINEMIKSNSGIHGISFEEQMTRTVDILDRNMAIN